MSETDRYTRTEPSEEDYNKIPRGSLAMRLSMDPRRNDQFDQIDAKKKLKILKQALLKEKELTVDQQKLISDQNKKIEVLQQDLEVKDQTIINLDKKLNLLQLDLSLQIEKNQQSANYKQQLSQQYQKQFQQNSQFNQPLTSPRRKMDTSNLQILEESESIGPDGQKNGYLQSLGNFLGFGYPTQYMKQEVYKQMIIRVEECDKQNAELILQRERQDEKIKELIYQIQEIKTIQQQQEKSFSQALMKKDHDFQELQKSFSLLKQQKELIEKQLKSSLYDLDKQKRDQNKLQNEIKQFQQETQALQIKIKYMNNSLEEYQLLNDQKEQIIKTFQQQINNQSNSVETNNQEKINFEQSEKKSSPGINLQLNHSLQNNQQNVQIYKLIKIGGITNQDSLLILRKNIEENPIFEIETKSEKIIILAGEVQKLQSDPSTFTLVQKTLQNQNIHHTFECHDNYVKQQIQDFIDKAPIMKSQGYNNSKYQNKGLINGIFSMINKK